MQRSIADRFHHIHDRIRTACQRSGRDPAEVTLVGASKRQPIERLREAYQAGLRHFGENQVQEGEERRPLLPDDTTWHLIGPLQSNKAARAAAIFDVVHSIDRKKIMRRLAAGRARAIEKPGPLDVFLEINIGNEESKHGFEAGQLEQALVEVRSYPRLRPVGLMAIPPWERDPGEARAWFRAMRELRDDVAPNLPLLSMGMSADFEIAIEEGATHIRVGTELFGPRD